MSALPSAYAPARTQTSAVSLLTGQSETASTSARSARSDNRGGVRADVFSQTLQSRMPERPRNDGPRTPDSPGPERKTTSPSREASARERPASSTGERQADSSQPADARPATQSANSAGSTEAAREQTGSQPESQQVESGSNADTSVPASLAGLPAAIAALLAGQRDNKVVEDGTDSLLANANGGKKSPHNASALAGLGKNAAEAQTTPELQAKAVVTNAVSATMAALRTADANPALARDGADAHTQLQGSAMHLHASTQVLRPTQGMQAATQLHVPTPVGQQAWAEDVGNQVRWMLGRAESKAELVLTPPNLGKLEVSISLNGDLTTAQFVASSQAARDALERAMPQLREILEQAGIMLGNADVSTSGQQGGDGETAGREQGRGAGEGEGLAAGTTPVGGSAWVKEQTGMVDTFA